MTANHYAPAWLTKWLAAPDDDDDRTWYGPPQVVLHVPGRGTVYQWNFTRFEAEAMTGEAVTDAPATEAVQRWLCAPADPSMGELWTNEMAIARETVAGWPLFPANQLDLFASTKPRPVENFPHPLQRRANRGPFALACCFPPSPVEKSSTGVALAHPWSRK